MMRALITGIAGQDGFYLSELLLSRGYEVHGVLRPGGTVDGLEEVVLHPVDLSVGNQLAPLIIGIEPDEVYNLAAISSVFRSWREPALTERINAGVVAELLAAVSDYQASGMGRIRFVQASSAEIFGAPSSSPQSERTPLLPSSPYGAAKAYAHQLVGLYRAAGLHASSCILYNHESPRRPESFVTRKITLAAARIAAGLQDRLELGNLDARRDWGWAPDYVDALHRAAAAPAPGDYVIATGVTHSVGEFAEAAFARAGVDDWRSRVDVSAKFMRVGDVPEQVGDATLAAAELGWTPTRNFDEIVASMVDSDVRSASG
jgi:GDPmannose 4,6-dehydratase